jgi:hypothetical protein
MNALRLWSEPSQPERVQAVPRFGFSEQPFEPGEKWRVMGFALHSGEVKAPMLPVGE